MDKVELGFDDFLREVNPANIGFFTELHDFMLQNGYKIKIEIAKSGYVVSYVNIKTKKVVINYVFRKNGMLARIYGDNVNKYLSLLNTLPDEMKKAIEKAPVCKRLLDPTKCNSRCPMGYDFMVNDVQYKNCRYSSFMFEIKEENNSYIREFIENEVRERTA